GRDQVVHSCYGRQHNCLWILALVLLIAEAFSKSLQIGLIESDLFILSSGVTKSSCFVDL
ncbi:hypothetical protein, partial [Acinetobacter seifertii]|uniref:hypothetical protein n=1 Tax=Acinetobacter seifertii TaxID=1530123 RepID=UPI001C2E5280